MIRKLNVSDLDLPKPPPLKKIIGPSFILLGLGLGSGELILWPYLASNYGLGIIWGAVIGITFQFFINMEIERYTLATGESVFVGLSRMMGKFSPLWFIFTTFLPWIWPGIIASSASILAYALGIKYQKIIPILLLFIIGVILSLGKYLYKTQEKFQKSLIFIGIPFIILLTVFLVKPVNYIDLFKGVVGIGKGYLFLPAGISFATFLGALAYAGAGGNLNLSQSYYVKEKGFGMGKYSGKIAGLFSKEKKSFDLEGALFQNNFKNIKVYRLWWRRINLEHGIIFWLTGAITILLLSLLAFSTAYLKTGVETGINFLFKEGLYISENTIPFIGTAFLLIASLMLFGTQFSVFGATSRILSENFVIFSPKTFKAEKLSYLFYIFLWLQIIAGCLIFILGFTEPLTLVIIGAVMNAVTMFVYTVMIYFLNLKTLPVLIRPSLKRRVIIISAILFYGSFSLITILKYFFNF